MIDIQLRLIKSYNKDYLQIRKALHEDKNGTIWSKWENVPFILEGEAYPSGDSPDPPNYSGRDTHYP